MFLCLMEADIFSIDRCSSSEFFQWVTVMAFLVFQFMRMIFLAMVRAVSRAVEVFFVILIVDMSPNRHNSGVRSDERRVGKEC